MRVGVAGTFGPIHDGHRALFAAALERGDEGVVVGLTTDRFARQSRSRPVPAFETRRRALGAELDRLDEWGRDIEIRSIEDKHDIAATDPSLDALVVSPETAPELAAINTKRRERGLSPLEGIVIPFVRATDGDRISSTRVVAGEIDEHGHLQPGTDGREES